jgi:hypothetical protein
MIKDCREQRAEAKIKHFVANLADDSANAALFDSRTITEESYESNKSDSLLNV